MLWKQSSFAAVIEKRVSWPACCVELALQVTAENVTSIQQCTKQ
jgi:hypothetical protein